MSLHVLITGGAGELGRAIAHRCVARGDSVVLVDASATALDAALSDLQGTTSDVTGIVADVTAEADVHRYVTQTVKLVGRIDAFFNNAGVEGAVAPITQQDADTFRRVVDVNLTGAFLGLKHVLPHMIARGSGAVVNTASTAGIRGAANLAPYVASKHALVGLTKSAALEVAPFGVRVNAICPSGIEGRMIASIEDQGSGFSPVPAPKLAEINPSGRLGTMDEVADVAVFLASDSARYVNGAAWVIDGARTAR